MFLFYYDEVKFNPPTQDSFYLGGVAIRDQDVSDVEERVNRLARSIFGLDILDRGREFHGIGICQGKGVFKGAPFGKRMEVLDELITIITSPQVHRFFIEIRPHNIVATPDSPDEIAFMFLIEGINRFLAENQEIGMLFGDYDEPQIGSSVVSLSRFKRQGTRWARSQEIDRLLDTVHFAKSHHSRLIQLADVYLYLKQFYRFGETAKWRKAISDKIIESGILKASFSKCWPNEAVWYR